MTGGILRNALRQLTLGLAMAGLLAMLLFAVCTIADGVLRWALDAPIDAVRDLGNMVAAASMACCLPHVLLTRSNITIRFVSAFVGGQPSRFVELFAAICVAAVLCGMTWQFYLFAGTTARAGESTPLLGIPVAPSWYFIDGVLAVAVVVQLLVLAEEASALIHRAPTRRAPPHHG